MRKTLIKWGYDTIGMVCGLAFVVIATAAASWMAYTLFVLTCQFVVYAATLPTWP